MSKKCTWHLRERGCQPELALEQVPLRIRVLWKYQLPSALNQQDIISEEDLVTVQWLLREPHKSMEAVCTYSMLFFCMSMYCFRVSLFYKSLLLHYYSTCLFVYVPTFCCEDRTYCFCLFVPTHCTRSLPLPLWDPYQPYLGKKPKENLTTYLKRVSWSFL